MLHQNRSSTFQKRRLLLRDVLNAENKFQFVWMRITLMRFLLFVLFHADGNGEAAIIADGEKRTALFA